MYLEMGVDEWYDEATSFGVYLMTEADSGLRSYLDFIGSLLLL